MATTLRTIELSTLKYPETDLSTAVSVARFLDFFLHERTFARVIWLEPPMKDGFGRVVTSLKDAMRAKSDLQRATMKGWQILCVLKQAASRVVDFLEIAGYRVIGNTDDPLDFNPVIRSIELTPAETAVLFAHDGDPVYVMEVGG